MNQGLTVEQWAASSAYAEARRDYLKARAARDLAEEARQAAETHCSEQYRRMCEAEAELERLLAP